MVTGPAATPDGPRASPPTLNMAVNSLAVFSSGAAIRVMALAAFLLLSRALGPSGLGTFALVIATVEVVRQLAEMGLGPATVRRLSASHPKEWPPIITAGLGLRLAGAIIGFCGILLLTLVPDLAPNRGLFVIGGTILFTGATSAALIAPFQAALQMRHLFQVYLVASVLYLGLVAWGIAADWPVAGFLWAYVAQETIVLGGCTILFTSRYRLTLQSTSFAIRPLGSEAIPLGILALVVMLYFRVDVFMLDALVGREAVGQYSLAFRFSEAFLLAGAAISASTFPRFVALARDSSRREAQQLLSVLYRGAVISGTIIGLGVSLSAPAIIRALFPRFQEAGLLLAFLVWSVCFVFANQQTVDFLISMGRVRAVTAIATVNLGANVVLNVLLIPLHGALGAVLATVATEAINTALQGWYVSKQTSVRVPLDIWLFAAPAMAAALIHVSGGSPPMVVGLGALAVVMLLLAVLPNSEFRSGIFSVRRILRDVRPSPPVARHDPQKTD